MARWAVKDQARSHRRVERQQNTDGTVYANKTALFAKKLGVCTGKTITAKSMAQAKSRVDQNKLPLKLGALCLKPNLRAAIAKIVSE